jgi:hypothetical protein
MLWLERRVVDSLVQASDPDRRVAITEYVEGALRDMPEPIRAGVAGESLLLGAWPALRNAVGRFDDAQLAAQVERWEQSPIGLLRQYVRALHSLVLFAEYEMATGDGLAAGPNNVAKVQP